MAESRLSIKGIRDKNMEVSGNIENLADLMNRLNESVNMCEDKRRNVEQLEEGLKTVETTYKKQELANAKSDLQDFYEMTYNGIQNAKNDINNQRQNITATLSRQADMIRNLRSRYQIEMDRANREGNLETVKALADEENKHILLIQSEFNKLSDQLNKINAIESNLRNLEYKFPYRPEFNVSRNNGAPEPPKGVANQGAAIEQPNQQAVQNTGATQGENQQPQNTSPTQGEKPQPQSTSATQEDKPQPQNTSPTQGESQQTGKKQEAKPKENKPKVKKPKELARYTLKINGIQLSTKSMRSQIKKQVEKYFQEHNVPENKRAEITSKINRAYENTRALTKQRLDKQKEKEGLEAKLKNAKDDKEKETIKAQIKTITKEQAALTRKIKGEYTSLKKTLEQELPGMQVEVINVNAKPKTKAKETRASGEQAQEEQPNPENNQNSQGENTGRDSEQPAPSDSQIPPVPPVQPTVEEQRPAGGQSASMQPEGLAPDDLGLDQQDIENPEAAANDRAEQIFFDHPENDPMPQEEAKKKNIFQRLVEWIKKLIESIKTRRLERAAKAQLGQGDTPPSLEDDSAEIDEETQGIEQQQAEQEHFNETFGVQTEEQKQQMGRAIAQAQAQAQEQPTPGQSKNSKERKVMKKRAKAMLNRGQQEAPDDTEQGR